MKKIYTEKAPKVVGPYSQAIMNDNFIFCSGQIAINPTTNEMVKGGIKPETRQVLENLKAVLEAAGSSIEQVIKVEVYLADMANYSEMNEIYAEAFNSSTQPARVTVGVAKLPRNASVEIACIAYKK